MRKLLSWLIVIVAIFGALYAIDEQDVSEVFWCGTVVVLAGTKIIEEEN